jgi:hypothetical protein
MTFGLPTLLWLIYRGSHTGRPWSGDVIGGTGTRPNQDSRDATRSHHRVVARASFSTPAGVRA